ncbi:MAG: hypothetical protein EA424_23210 [Planctomycetaceae bacterium]|nr:MAG: hypothetical protein EA424_23210 [Planctomycetaceae bacterium]
MRSVSDPPWLATSPINRWSRPATRSPAKRSPAKRSPAKRSPTKRSPTTRSPAIPHGTRRVLRQPI